MPAVPGLVNALCVVNLILECGHGMNYEVPLSDVPRVLILRKLVLKFERQTKRLAGEGGPAIKCGPRVHVSVASSHKTERLETVSHGVELSGMSHDAMN